MTWLCHRTCEHCYEERFRPYYGEELRGVVAESEANYAKIIENLPISMMYRDLSAPDGAGGFQSKVGSVILAGGEILLDAVRDAVLYPGIRLLREKYAGSGGVKIIVQTTGDTLTPKIARELEALGVWMVSISGVDAFHKGLEKEQAREELRLRCRQVLEGAGFESVNAVGENSRQPEDDGHYYHFFGATPDMWIGKLWPRGRAMRNCLTTAAIEDNFCNQWSGGLNFLRSGYSGSEVSVDPEGNVFPCCVKTKKAIGNLREEKMESILGRLEGNPIYEAISMGHPERMGIAHGWSVEKFYEKSTMKLEDGRLYQNLCVGCDAFHDEVMGTAPLVKLG